MSRVTSCRLPRVFSSPPSLFLSFLLLLSFSFLSHSVRPPSNDVTYVLSQPSRVPSPFADSFCFLSPSSERYPPTYSTRLEHGAPSVSPILGGPSDRAMDPCAPPRLNVILYDLFDFASRGIPYSLSSAYSFQFFLLASARVQLVCNLRNLYNLCNTRETMNRVAQDDDHVIILNSREDCNYNLQIIGLCLID